MIKLQKKQTTVPMFIPLSVPLWAFFPITNSNKAAVTIWFFPIILFTICLPSIVVSVGGVVVSVGEIVVSEEGVVVWVPGNRIKLTL